MKVATPETGDRRLETPWNPSAIRVYSPRQSLLMEWLVAVLSVLKCCRCPPYTRFCSLGGSPLFP